MVIVSGRSRADLDGWFGGLDVALVAEHGAALSEAFVKQVALATNVSGVEYQEAMFARTALFRRVQSLLARGHLLAMPTITRTALPIDQDLFGTIEIDGQHFDSVRPHWFPWTMPFNMTGHPAVGAPAKHLRPASGHVDRAADEP